MKHGFHLRDDGRCVAEGAMMGMIVAFAVLGVIIQLVHEDD